ncbi:hypothetical protein [Halorubrum sp. Hd13]|uniref:hypothetical protein n=1 Tax=Halorubrum sp. Hd13 TaxID=1480728 RepID=UPI00113FF076|nr:hypothetical protein [Halorubrum sp. Hd13]
MSIWGWSLLLLGVVAIVVGQTTSDDEGAFTGVGDSRIGAAGWGVTLAGLAYILYLSYTASDVTNAFAWAVGPGRVWAGLGIVGYGGYTWTRVADDVETGRGMVDGLQDAIREPILQFGGVVTTILVTAVVGVISVALVGGELLGFGLGLFADAPGFTAAIFATVLGFVSTGGSLPLVDAFVPDVLRSMSPAYWVAIMLGVISLALGFASDNFEEGLR